MRVHYRSIGGIIEAGPMARSAPMARLSYASANAPSARAHTADANRALSTRGSIARGKAAQPAAPKTTWAQNVTWDVKLYGLFDPDEYAGDLPSLEEVMRRRRKGRSL